MAQSLSAEEFGRIQGQIIELRTKNYELEATSQRQQSELKEIQDKLASQEKELQKANKIINKSKNKKEYAILFEENESYQRQFQAQEENFKLQNQTLLEEINKLNEDNGALQKENERLQSGGSQEPGSGNDAEIRRLRAESAALQKSLANAHEKHQHELLSLEHKVRSFSRDSIEPPVSEHSAGLQPQDEEVRVDGERPEGTLPQDSNKNVLQLRQILHDELDAFRTSICTSLEKDRSEVGESRPSDGESSQSTPDGGSHPQVDDNTSHSHDIHNQVLDLGTRLQGMLEPLLSTQTDGLQVDGGHGGVLNADIHVIQQAESRIAVMEEQIKYMSGLQLRLDTELEEKRILQEQLQQREESSKKETTELRDDISKLSDKIKKKQESYLQLQEEKEKLYSENKKVMEDLKSKKDNEIRILAEQMTKLQEEMGVVNQRYYELQEDSSVTIKELQNSVVKYHSQASNSAEATEQVVAQLRQEKEALGTEISDVKQKLLMSAQEAEETADLISELEKRLHESENKTAQFTVEAEELREQLKEQHAAVDGWNTQIQQLSEERDQFSSQYDDMAKTAEKRKSTLDQMAIERQNVDITHRQAIDKLHDEHKKEVAYLKDQLTGEKKLRKEVEDLQQKLADNKTKLQAAESKCGWFERRLEETEEMLKTEKEQNEKTLNELKEKHEEELAVASEEREKQEEELNTQIESLQSDLHTMSSEMENMSQELRDKEVETRIASKKGDQLVKDLKRQVRLERKRGDQLHQKLQDALSENRAKQNFDELFSTPGSLPRRNSGDSSILSHNRSDLESPELRGSSPSGSMTNLLSEDTVDLIERLADVQQEKWLLEEKVRHLEETGGALADDLVQKSEVIQAYAMETRIGAICGSPKQDTLTTLKEKVKVSLPFGKTKTDTKRIQLMLEETLMKNIQLHKDVDSLSKELEKYKQQPERSSEDATQQTDGKGQMTDGKTQTTELQAGNQTTMPDS